MTVPPLSCLVCLVDLPVFSSFAFLHCRHALLSIETHELNDVYDCITFKRSIILSTLYMYIYKVMCIDALSYVLH